METVKKKFDRILDNVYTDDDRDDVLLNTEGVLRTPKIDEKVVYKDKQIIFNKKATDTNSLFDNTNKIVELSESGLRKEEIARMLGKGIGEVEIILRLQNKKNS